MRLHQHVAVSTVVSLGLYAWTQSLPISIYSFFAGFLIDLDHVLDYWKEHPFRLDLFHFFRTCEEFRLIKVYLFLHSVELIILLALAAFFTRSEWIVGTLIGVSQHLILDQLFNPISPYAYSFFYRLSKGFMNDKIFMMKA